MLSCLPPAGPLPAQGHLPAQLGGRGLGRHHRRLHLLRLHLLRHVLEPAGRLPTDHHRRHRSQRLRHRRRHARSQQRCAPVAILTLLVVVCCYCLIFFVRSSVPILLFKCMTISPLALRRRGHLPLQRARLDPFLLLRHLHFFAWSERILLRECALFFSLLLFLRRSFFIQTTTKICKSALAFLHTNFFFF